jgi:hypothetical protein
VVAESILRWLPSTREARPWSSDEKGAKP